MSRDLLKRVLDLYIQLQDLEFNPTAAGSKEDHYSDIETYNARIKRIRELLNDPSATEEEYAPMLVLTDEEKKLKSVRSSKFKSALSRKLELALSKDTELKLEDYLPKLMNDLFEERRAEGKDTELKLEDYLSKLVNDLFEERRAEGNELLVELEKYLSYKGLKSPEHESAQDLPHIFFKTKIPSDFRNHADRKKQYNEHALFAKESGNFFSFAMRVNALRKDVAKAKLKHTTTKDELKYITLRLKVKRLYDQIASLSTNLSQKELCINAGLSLLTPPENKKPVSWTWERSTPAEFEGLKASIPILLAQLQSFEQKEISSTLAEKRNEEISRRRELRRYLDPLEKAENKAQFELRTKITAEQKLTPAEEMMMFYDKGLRFELDLREQIARGYTQLSQHFKSLVKTASDLSEKKKLYSKSISMLEELNNLYSKPNLSQIELQAELNKVRKLIGESNSNDTSTNDSPITRTVVDKPATQASIDLAIAQLKRLCFETEALYNELSKELPLIARDTEENDEYELATFPQKYKEVCALFEKPLLNSDIFRTVNNTTPYWNNLKTKLQTIKWKRLSAALVNAYEKEMELTSALAISGFEDSEYYTACYKEASAAKAQAQAQIETIDSSSLATLESKLKRMEGILLNLEVTVETSNMNHSNYTLFSKSRTRAQSDLPPPPPPGRNRTNTMV